jgi:outer membrane immunogenic protein
MRKCLPAIAGVAAMLCTTGAQAEPPTRWAGFYLGAHIGQGWGNNEWRDYGDPMNGTNYPGPDAHYGIDGFLAGGHIGYNWQVGRTVLGVEADASWANITGLGNNAPSHDPAWAPGGCFLVDRGCDTEIQALGTLTARLGYAFHNTLVYVKGGAAWARERQHSGFHDPNFPNDPFSNFDATVTGTRWGWTAGAGVEYAFGKGWSGRIDYSYIDLGNDRFGFTYTPAQSFGASATSEETLHVVKLGVTYRFETDIFGPIPPASPEDAKAPPSPGAFCTRGERSGTLYPRCSIATYGRSVGPT